MLVKEYIALFKRNLLIGTCDEATRIEKTIKSPSEGP